MRHKGLLLLVGAMGRVLVVFQVVFLVVFQVKNNV